MPFCVGFEAFAFLGFSALGLRTSLLDFFWLLAIGDLLRGRVVPRAAWASTGSLSNDYRPQNLIQNSRKSEFRVKH